MDKANITGSIPCEVDNYRINNFLNLDRTQAAKLCAFPPAIISHLVSSLGYNLAKGLPKPNFEQVYKWCQAVCTKENISLDLRWAEYVEEYAKRQVANGIH
jgi:hypothetical protein